MLELSLYVEASPSKKPDADMKKVDDALLLLRQNGFCVNGAINDMDGNLLFYVVNGFKSKNLFRMPKKVEVNDGEHNDDSGEEAKQLSFDTAVHTGDNGDGSGGNGSRACC